MNSKENVSLDRDANMPDLLDKEVHYEFRDVQLHHMAAPLTEHIGGTNEGQNNIQLKRRNVCDAFNRYFGFDNATYRRNFIQTTCIFVNFLLLGWTYGQLGTTFQDLQLLLNINVKQTSLVFTANSIGYMIGGLSIGFLPERVDTLLSLGVLTLLTGIISIVQPWASYHVVFLVLRLFAGGFCGAVDAGGNAKACACWGVGVRPYMLAIHFGYGLGGVLAPLATIYFLAPRLENLPNLNQTINGTISPNDSLINTTGFLFNSSNVALEDVDSLSRVRYGETKVALAFVMTGILTIASGCFYIILYIRDYSKTPQYMTKQYQNVSISNEAEIKYKRVKLSRKQTVGFLIVFGLGIIAYAAVECKLQSFIMPFVLLELNWTKVNGAFLISMVWTFYSIGRFSGITISRFVSPRSMILIFFSLTIASTAGIWIGAVTRINALIWIFVPCSGFAISVIFPTFLNYFNEQLFEVNGRIAGYFLLCGSLGFLLDPLYIGVLMENVSPMYFVYIQIAQAAFGLAIFIALFVVVSAFRKRNLVQN